MFVYGYVNMNAGVHGGQRLQIPLELWAVVVYPTWVLAFELRSFLRAGSALNLSTLSTAPPSFFIYVINFLKIN